MARVFIFNAYKWYQKYQKNGGRAGEFSRTFEELNEDCVWFHDPDNAWYQQDYWPDKIQKEIDIHGTPKLVLGCSMGGWGALLHQPIIQADTVLAFNPTMTTDPDLLEKWGHKWWAANCRRFTGARKTMPLSDGRARLYYGSVDDKPHRKIAETLGYNITISGKDHGSAAFLSKQGELVPLIKSYLL